MIEAQSLPPLTSVLVALRSKTGERISALPHVVATISECLDYGLPQFWSLPRACEANLLWMLPRLEWHQSRDMRFADVDPFHWSYQCRLGLVSAAKHGSLAMAEWLHEYCPSVLPYHAMIEAARAGQLQILDWLTDHHKRAVWIPQIMDAAASTNQLHVLQWLHSQPNNGGCTSKAFVSAVVNGHLDAVKWLQYHYPNTIKNPHHDILEAIRNGHTDVAMHLYEQPQFSLSLGAAIERAAEVGDLEFIKWRVSIIPKNRSTAPLNSRMLDCAAGGGHLEVLQWLHAHFPNERPRFALSQAARGGHLNVVKWLHSKRIEGNAAHAMDYAASGGHLDAVKWLHENRAGRCSTLAMDDAAKNGHLEVLKWLHENRTEGCSPNALAGACTNGHLEVAQWLFERVTQECDAYTIDNAAAGGHLDVIKWIAEHSVGGGECTHDAMDNAAENGHFHVVQWLHKRVLEEEAPDAIDRAAQNGHLDIVEWLLSNRDEGCTAETVAFAAQNGHFDVVLFLHGRIESACISADVIEDARECIEHMEMVQWLFDENPLSLNVEQLSTQASYMPAVLSHILELKPTFKRQKTSHPQVG
ncbi:hypothetical protein Gpo141_00002125 [Globisporangium polare]